MMKSAHKKQRSQISEKDILDFLQAVEKGEITLTPNKCIPQEVYAGDVPYSASNGWSIVVFNDCNDWDYLDSVQRGGQSLDFKHFVDYMPKVAAYRPSDIVAWERYKIPGYLKFRCNVCGRMIKNDGTYLCHKHKA